MCSKEGLTRLFSIHILDNEPLSVAELDNILQNDPAHRACQLEYKQLKEEFENYKKENKISKNINESKDSSQELSTILRKSEKLEIELKDLRLRLKAEEEGYIEKISCLQCEMTNLEEKNKNDVLLLEENHKSKVMMLELQLTKQRERTLKLIADQETEIKRLKGEHGLNSPTDKRHFESCHDNDISSHGNQPTNQQDGIEKRSVETEAAVKQLLQRQNSVSSLVHLGFPQNDNLL